MVRRLATSGDRVDVINAAAGSGKTTALDAVTEAYTSSGVAVPGRRCRRRRACRGDAAETVRELRAKGKTGSLHCVHRLVDLAPAGGEVVSQRVQFSGGTLTN